MSVVVPAHDEAAVLRRLLRNLTVDVGVDDRQVEIVVASNGSTDGTAAVARSFPGVVVIEIDQASKRMALEAGDAVARHAVRAYVDADVVITRADLLLLVDALRGGWFATAPARRLELDRSSLLVRWYYDVWQRLPQVGDGVFGRGVIVLSAEGHARVRRLPSVMSDDLAISEALAPDERAVIQEASVVIEAPRTLRGAGAPTRAGRHRQQPTRRAGVALGVGPHLAGRPAADRAQFPVARGEGGGLRGGHGRRPCVRPAPGEGG